MANTSFAQKSKRHNPPPVRVVDPDKKTSTAQTAAIDTESFEIGTYIGLLSVEDFNSNPSLGLSFIYHLDEKWYIQANYGQSDVRRASFEKQVGGDFLLKKDRRFKYTTVTAARRVFKGRSFLGSRNKYNSALYVLVGTGNIKYAANSGTGTLLGASYRAVITDWFAMNMDFKTYIFKRDFNNDDKRTLNNELTVGVNFFF